MNRRDFLKINVVAIGSIALPSISVADAIKKSESNSFFGRKEKISLENINDRRLISKLKQDMGDGLLFNLVLFEFNDSRLRSDTIALMSGYFDKLVEIESLKSYKIVCDETNNSPTVVDSNRFVMDLSIVSGFSGKRIDIRSEIKPNTLDFVGMV